MQTRPCSVLLCKGTDLGCSWDPWGPKEDVSSSQLKGVWATLSLLAPSPSSSSVLIQCHRQIYLHLFLLKHRSPNCPSDRSLSSTSHNSLKNFKRRSGHQRDAEMEAACPWGGFSTACAPEKGAAEAIFTRKRCRRAQLNETQSAGCRQDGVSVEARGVGAGGVGEGGGGCAS